MPNNNIFITPLTKQGGAVFGEINSANIYGFDPSVIGYIHVYIDGIHPVLMEAAGNIFDTSRFRQAIPTLARGFTIPEYSIQEIDYAGMLHIRTPGQIQQGSELSIRFIDTHDLNLTNFYTRIIKELRPLPLENQDNSIHKRLVELVGNGWKSNTTMNALIFATDPGLDLVTNAVACFGLWPKGLPKDHLNVEIGDVSLYTFIQNFSSQYIYAGADLLDIGQDVLDQFRADDTIY
jgi:hypothetical protein